MREIKFRGKRVDNGEWVYGYLYGKNAIIEFTSEYTVTSLGIFIVGVHQVIPETVGEFTGLKDKNGVEIYEGDIGRIKLPDGAILIAEVRWVDSAPCWVAKQFCVSLMKVVFNLRNSNVEVIRNIYANQELLGEKP